MSAPISPERGGQDPGADAAFLAALHEARRLAQFPVMRDFERASGQTSNNRPTAGTAPVSLHALFRHATRAPGAPVSLALERALREDGALAARYRAMLTGRALAAAPMAIAAADGALAARRVGPFALSLLPATADAPALLLITLPEHEPTPAMLEARGTAGAVRVALGTPADGVIILSLEAGHAEAEALAALFADGSSEFYLL